MSRVNYIILKPINGQTHRIILTQRKLAAIFYRDRNSHNDFN